MSADVRARSGRTALWGRPLRAAGRDLVLAVVMVGLILSGAVSLWLWHTELERTGRALEARGEVLVHAADDATAEVAARLRAVAGLYVASEEVTRDEFNRFVDGIGTTPGIDGVGYVVDTGPDGAPNLAVRQWFGTTDGIDPERIVADPVHLEATRTAARTRTMVGTPFSESPSTGGTHVALYWAIAEEPTSPVIGFAVASVDVAAVTADHVPSAVAEVVDWSVGEVDPAAIPASASDAVWAGTVSVGDRSWMYTVTPRPGSDIVPDGAGALLVLIAGAIATGLAAGGVHLRRQQTATSLENQKLKELTKAKDQFLASVSHELRTPLTGVLGFAELLRDGHGDMSGEEREAMISAVADEAADLATIMEDLLVAARAELDLVMVASTVVPVRAQVAQVLETLGLRPADVSIVGDQAGALQAAGDAGRIRQILRNLITNAHRYGGDRVEVRLLRGSGTVAIQVADDGSGLPAEQWDRIFEPYYRAHPEGTQPASIGIGLTVARHLARLMDGDLTYRQHAGWSVFELSLPEAHEPAEAPAAIVDTPASEDGLRRIAG